MNKDIKKVELLSPAGNIESFKFACSSGANAIYMGLPKFNARAMAENFDIEKYIECLKYAHIRQIKVYLTLNTLLYDNEIEEALNLVLELYSHGLDAVIVQDVGLASLIHKIIPNLALHASTQMSIYNLDQVKYLEKLGFKRVVLARELTIKEIEYICKNTELEIEVFVHGALCVAVSGQCLLSSNIGSRSANRGQCAQPCRMKYSLYSKKDNKLIEDNRYLLSKKDIFGINVLDKLVESGITSLKIEGRNKSPEYVAITTSTYRKYLENLETKAEYIVDEVDKENLVQTFNRSGISTGYLEKVNRKESITLLTPKNTGSYLGKVIDQKKEYIKVKLENDIDMHDGIEIYSEDSTVSSIVTCIRDEHSIIKNSKCRKDEYVWIGDVKGQVKFSSPIYKTTSDSLNKTYYNKYNTIRTITPNIFDVEININNGINISATAKNMNINVAASLDHIPETAKSKAISKETIIASFEKLLDTPFSFNINILLDDNLFVPVSILNELRRKLVEQIEKAYDINIDIKKELLAIKNIISNKTKAENLNAIKIKNALYIYEYDIKKDYRKTYQSDHLKTLERIDILIYDYLKYKEDIKNKYSDIELYIIIPNIVDSRLSIILNNGLETYVKDGVKGFIVQNIGYIDILSNLKKKYDIGLIADYHLNISNYFSAMKYINEGFDIIVPSSDISSSDIVSLAEYVNIEIVNDYLTVLTSRYCILGSFIASDDKKCSLPCLSEKYYLKDSYGYLYNIVTNHNDCIMRLVKKIRNIDIAKYNIEKIVSIREVAL